MGGCGRGYWVVERLWVGFVWLLLWLFLCGLGLVREERFVV